MTQKNNNKKNNQIAELVFWIVVSAIGMVITVYAFVLVIPN